MLRPQADAAGKVFFLASAHGAVGRGLDDAAPGRLEDFRPGVVLVTGSAHARFCAGFRAGPGDSGLAPYAYWTATLVRSPASSAKLCASSGR